MVFAIKSGNTSYIDKLRSASGIILFDMLLDSFEA